MRVAVLVAILMLVGVHGAEVGVQSRCDDDCCRSLSDRLPMSFTYYQRTGRLVGGTGEFHIDTHGYSGQDKGYLNPEEQCSPFIGPIPASTYKLTACKNKMHETRDTPCSFILDPQVPEEMCGRNDFLIHGCQCCTSGDDSQPPAAGCSAGCVVISYENRRKLRVGDILVVKHDENEASLE
jgi:hypothetical protein